MQRLHTFEPDDIAVLFGLMCYHESSGPLLDLHVRNRIWPVNIPPERLAASIDRLIGLGEIEVHEIPTESGIAEAYSVARHESFFESMEKWGHQAYNRRYQQRRREVAKYQSREQNAV